jgi:hypothetical protein
MKYHSPLEELHSDLISYGDEILDDICVTNMDVYCVRFEVFTAVTMKNVVFWDVTPCGSCKNRRFGGTWRLLHQGDKNR